MIEKRKYLPIAAIAAVALVATACSDNDRTPVATAPAPAPAPDEQEMMPTGPTPDEIAAATKAAGTKETAITAEAAQTDDAGLADTVTMTIARDSDGTTITFADTALAGDDDPKFAMAEDLGDGRTMHVRAMDADDDGNVVEEVVVVSTDIDAPKATPFADVHMLDTNPNDATPPVNQSVEIVAGNLEMIMTDGITAVGEGEITVLAAVEDNDQTPDVDETVAAFETAATFAGAAGTLKCAGATDCTVTLGAEGAITDFGTGWEFTPDADETVDVADTDYLHYGFWLQRTTDADGVLTYDEVQTFAGSSIAATGSVTQVTGSATYDGGATGVYVKNNEYDSATGEVTDASSGHFTADASLTATFGQLNDDDNVGTIAPNLLNTLSGTIDGFELSGGEANEWSVNLQGDIDTVDGTASGAANGGGDPGGTFSATFHGPNEDADNDPIAPHTVVGEFNTNFGNGSAAGGFGARKQ